MKELEVIGQIDAQGRLLLEHLPLPSGSSNQVRVVLFYPDDEHHKDVDPDDTPIEEVEASLRRAFQEIKEGKRIPLSDIWDELAKEDDDDVV